MESSILIKKEKGFVLLNEDETQPIGSTLSHSEGRKLSLNNCEDIALGIDLDELAKEFCDRIDEEEGEAWSSDFEELPKKMAQFTRNILQLFSDRQFTADEVVSIVEKSRNTGLTGEYLTLVEKEKKNKWEVEVEMRSKNIDELRESGEGFLNNNNLYIPNLDEDGCLILKRKHH